MPKDLIELEEQLDIKFNDRVLLKQIFIHRSYLNENNSLGIEHNERLEFLGDAVLELVVTEYLYKTFPNPEGELTNWRSALVRGVMLAGIALNLNFGDYLFLSRGEQNSGGKARQLILANTLEAFIGALYLDKGYVAAQEFINKYIIVNITEIIDKKLYLDAKSKLQEHSQEVRGVTPNYKVLSESGPDHNKTFTVGVYLDGKLIGQGSGSSKQNAEQSAAISGFESLATNHSVDDSATTQ